MWSTRLFLTVVSLSALTCFSIAEANEQVSEWNPILDDTTCSSSLTMSELTIIKTFTTVLITSASGTTAERATSVYSILPPISFTDSPSWTSSPSTTTCVEDDEEWNVWETPGSSSTSTTTALPSGCPYNNGTLFKENSDNCTYYQRICGESYAEVDFLPFTAGYDNPEQCTALCDALNRGAYASCLGIVWTTANDTRANCKALRSLTTPVEAKDSIALLIMDLHNPACLSGVTVTSTRLSTTTNAASTTPSWSTWSSASSSFTLITTPSSSSSTKPLYSSSQSTDSHTINTDTTTTTKLLSSTSATTPIATSISSTTVASTPTSTSAITSTAATCPSRYVTVSETPIVMTVTEKGSTTTVTVTVTDPGTTTITRIQRSSWQTLQ